MDLDKYNVDLIKPTEVLGKTDIIDIVTLSGGRTSFYCDNQGKKF